MLLFLFIENFIFIDLMSLANPPNNFRYHSLEGLSKISCEALSGATLFYAIAQEVVGTKEMKVNQKKDECT